LFLDSVATLHVSCLLIRTFFDGNFWLQLNYQWVAVIILVNTETGKIYPCNHVHFFSDTTQAWKWHQNISGLVLTKFQLEVMLFMLLKPFYKLVYVLYFSLQCSAISPLYSSFCVSGKDGEKQLGTNL